MITWGLIAAGAVIVGLGLSARFTFWRSDIEGTPVLMYHYLSDDLAGTGLGKLRVSPGAFNRQIEYLETRGYQSVGLMDYYEHVTSGRPLPERSVIITFDDGARDCLLQARDVLARCGFSAAVFVVADHVGGTNVWDRPKGEPEIKLLSWEELQELAAAGWEVGSHTRTHADLTALADEELAEELSGSKKILEQGLGREVLAVSYPFGRNDQRVRAAARAAGYGLGLTTRPGKNTPTDDLMDLRRIIIKRRDTRLDLALKLRKGRSTL